MSKPLSEELRDLAVDGEKLAAQMYTGPTTLRRCADRAAALEREVEELRETLVPKSALEWLAAKLHSDYCPADCEDYLERDEVEQNCDQGVSCWMRVALEAAEEADSNAD